MCSEWIHQRFVQTQSHPENKIKCWNLSTDIIVTPILQKKVMPTISKSWRTYQIWSIFFKELLLLKMNNNLWFDHSKNLGIYDILRIPYIKWNVPWLSQTHFTHKNLLMSICQTLVVVIIIIIITTITTTGISRVYLSLSFPYLGHGRWIEGFVVGLFESRVMWSINPSIHP